LKESHARIAQQHAAYYAARALGYDTSAGYGNSSFEALVAPLKAKLTHLLSGTDLLEIACGTGYWTDAIAPSVPSIHAIDADVTSLRIAERRLERHKHVRTQRADAYSMDNVEGCFGAALAMFWWSHMPLTDIPDFLATLRKKLRPAAPVIFVDQLFYPYPDCYRRLDDEGNILEQRWLSGGSFYEVVRNFPTESDLRSAVEKFSVNARYESASVPGCWLLSYESR
jgi:SAM-dependent methyltransferase